MPWEAFVIAIMVPTLLFVVAPAVVLHYVTQWKKAGALKPEDEHMLEDMWRTARAMERRLETLEAILDAESPGWRRRDGEAAAARPSEQERGR